GWAGGGQAPSSVAAQGGGDVPGGTRVLVVPLPCDAVPGPWGREKLAPLLPLFTTDGRDDGLRLCRQILGNGGSGHTAIIHTRSQRLALSFAPQMPAPPVPVNNPRAPGCPCPGPAAPPPLPPAR